jgi:hypothetical protein
MGKTQEKQYFEILGVINDLYIFKMYFKNSKSTQQKVSGHRKRVVCYVNASFMRASYCLQCSCSSIVVQV